MSANTQKTPAFRELDFDTADSAEEVHFSWWLDELQEAGFIRAWAFQPETFRLFDEVKYEVKKQLKTKVRVDQKPFLRGHTYTPDFRIEWNDKARGVFFARFTDYVRLDKFPFVGRRGYSYVDVKPKQWRGNSFMEAFTLNQKWTYQVYGVYVQPIVTWGGKKSVFEATFTPNRFLFTDKTGKARALRFTPRSLADFLSQADLEKHNNLVRMFG